MPHEVFTVRQVRHSKMILGTTIQVVENSKNTRKLKLMYQTSGKRNNCKFYSYYFHNNYSHKAKKLSHSFKRIFWSLKILTLVLLSLKIAMQGVRKQMRSRGSADRYKQSRWAADVLGAKETRDRIKKVTSVTEPNRTHFEKHHSKETQARVQN